MEKGQPIHACSAEKVICSVTGDPVLTSCFWMRERQNLCGKNGKLFVQRSSDCLQAS